MLRKGMFISDRYEIIDKVGSGGMSDVYKAKCHKLNRYVAIKVLKPEFSEDKNFVSKFKVEAQSAAGLAHPNIVSVFDVGEDNGLHYIVMELVEGITLKKYIEKKGRLSVKEAVSIAIQVAQGIEAAHNNHIIHRDIKPQNIIISREGKVKVTDFGIARAASANTINSNAMGSVHYISPEQARGGFIDEKSDIYSLGITLYEMITGSGPFEGDTTVTIALHHIQGEIPPAKNIVEDLPISVEKIIEKCTQKKPDRRYLKVSSLIADLKKSLITPDEDFVQMVPEQNNQSTVIISDDDVALIRRETGMSTEPEEDMIDDTTAEISSLNPEDEDIDDDIEDEEEDNPKLDKIVINVGAGEARDNSKVIDSIVTDIAAITGQKPMICKAKKSVANFKLREGMNIGVKVTLRGDRMYEFLDRLFNVALPRVRDFRGINANSFDGRGNYNMGIKEQLIFPEIEYDKIDKVRGMDICFVTTANTDEEARELLTLMGAPFAK